MQFPASEVKQLHEQLKQISEQLLAENGLDVNLTEQNRFEEVIQHMQIRPTVEALEGDELVKDLLTRCFLWHGIVEQRLVDMTSSPVVSFLVANTPNLVGKARLTRSLRIYTRSSSRSGPSSKSCSSPRLGLCGRPISTASSVNLTGSTRAGWMVTSWMHWAGLPSFTPKGSAPLTIHSTP